MKIEIPDFALIVVLGPSGPLRSAFLARHFAKDEIVPADASGDSEQRHASAETLARIYATTQDRLTRRALTVIDVPNIRKEDRARVVHLAKSHFARSIAIVIEPAGIAPKNTPRLDKEGFRKLHILDSVEAIEAASVKRHRVSTDARHLAGPFDIIGDIHGCAGELETLLATLGYRVTWQRSSTEDPVRIEAPHGRRVVFLGDLVDRGPKTPDVLRIVMSMVANGTGLCVLGNHDVKFLRWLHGRNVQPGHGLDRSIAQMSAEPTAFRRRVAQFLEGLVSHYWLDDGRLAVAHAGIEERMIGRWTGAVQEFGLYGGTTGEIDSFGYPIRTNWAADYRGEPVVVYGHTPQRTVEWLNNTLCLDTGCVFGGRLTALRWPEREIVSVTAAKVWFSPKGQL